MMKRKLKRKKDFGYSNNKGILRTLIFYTISSLGDGDENIFRYWSNYSRGI